MVAVDERVHALDHGVEGTAGRVLLGGAAGVGGDGRGLAVHDLDLGGGGAEGEGIVAVGGGAAHHVVGRRRPLAQHHQHHRHVGLLDRVDEGLAQAEHLGLLGPLADVDPRRVLEPHHGQPVPAAQGDELVHLDEALPVELTAHARIVAVVGIALPQIALAVADAADEPAVDLADPGEHLGAVIGPELQPLAAVDEPREDLVEVVDLLLVRGQQMVQVVDGERGVLRRRRAEELGPVGGRRAHVLFQAVEHPGLFVVDPREEAGGVVVGGGVAGRARGERAGLLDQLFDHSGVEPALGGHARDDADAADGHVGVLVREQDGGADGLVAAAGGVGAVDAGQHRDARLRQLGVAEERGPRPAPVGVELLLLGQLRPAAMHQPHQGHVQPAGQVGGAQDVLGLAGQPRPRHHLVVEADDHRPAALDAPQAVDDVGGALLVLGRVVEGVQRAPGAGVEQVIEPLVDRHPAPPVDLLGREPRLFDGARRRRDVRLDRPQRAGALGRPLRPARLQGPAEAVHRLEIRLHGAPPHRFGAWPQAIPEMMSFCTFDVPSTTCSDLASR